MTIQITSPRKSFFDFLEEIYLAIINEFQDELAKEGVLPSEPMTAVFRGVVLVERLVHKTSASISIDEHLDALLNLLVVSAGKGSHHD